MATKTAPRSNLLEDRVRCSLSDITEALWGEMYGLVMLCIICAYASVSTQSSPTRSTVTPRAWIAATLLSSAPVGTVQLGIPEAGSPRYSESAVTAARGDDTWARSTRT